MCFMRKGVARGKKEEGSEKEGHWEEGGEEEEENLDGKEEVPGRTAGAKRIRLVGEGDR